MIRTQVFSPAKNGFKSDISIFCCSVSVYISNINFVINCNNQRDFCLRKDSDNSQCSTQRSDLFMKKQNKLRQSKSRLKLWQCLQDASRDLHAKLQYN